VQERFEEMRAMIAKREREGGVAGHVRTRSMPEDAPPPSPSADAAAKALRALEDAAFELDSTLTRGASNHGELAADLSALLAAHRAVRSPVPHAARVVR
jgi:hypothetical protein